MMGIVDGKDELPYQDSRMGVNSIASLDIIPILIKPIAVNRRGRQLLDGDEGLYVYGDNRCSYL